MIPLSASVACDPGSSSCALVIWLSDSETDRNREGICIPPAGLRIIRIQLNGATEFLLSIHEIPRAIHLRKGQRAMPFGKRIVQFNGLLCSGDCARKNY